MKNGNSKSTQCPNCASSLKGKENFCPNCGQKNHNLRVPIRHLFLEAFEDYFHVDNKLFRTMYVLIFKPGFLVNEFSAGKRMTYVPPVKLYVFLSFMFFLLLSINSHHHPEPLKTTSGNVNIDWESDSTGLSFSLFDVNSQELQGLSDTQIDSLMDNRGIERTSYKRFLFRQMARIGATPDSFFYRRVSSSISYMMFVLMPIFALFLYLFHRKRVKYYVDCLMFSIHFHSFVFLLFTICLLLLVIFDSLIPILVIPLILPVYFGLGLRRVFQQSRLLTVIKTILIGMLHTVSLLVLFLLLIVVNILTF
jgi:hypothetical protein